MKLHFAQLLLFFLCGNLFFNLALTNSSDLFINQLVSNKNPQSIDYKNAFSVFAKEVETFLQNEIVDLEKSLRVHSRMMNRPKRSINVDTSSRTSPGNNEKEKFEMLRFNLTLVKELFHIDGVTIEDVALIKPNGDSSPQYVIVAGQSIIGHFKPMVSLPILRLDGLKVTSVETVSVPGATRVESFVIDGTAFFIFAINTGRDFVDPIIHTSRLYKIDDRDGSVRSIQTFLTVSSSKWKSFLVDGQTYLAQASYMKYAETLRNSSQCDKTKLIAAKSVKVYEWNGKAFKRVSSLKGSYVTDIDDCSIRGRHFLLVSNRRMNSVGSNESYVYVYEISGTSRTTTAIKFRLFQKLPASAPRNIHCFPTSDTLFLAIADEYRLESGKRFYNKESLIYRFNGLFFVRYEKVSAFGGLEWSSLPVPGSNPSFLTLRLRTSNYEHLSFAVSDGKFMPLEMRSLYGIEHLIALNHDHVIASMRNNSVVLLKWNVQSDADSYKTCSHLNVQLKKILLQRISVEGELKDLVNKFKTGKELVTNVKRSSLTSIGQKLQRLEVEVMDVDRMLHTMIVKSESDGGLKHLVVDELSVGMLSARSLDVNTIDGVGFRSFVDNAVKVIPYSENRLSLGSVRFSQFRVTDSVVLKGTLNDGAFPSDFAMVDAVNTFSAPQTIKTVHVSKDLNVVEGVLDDVYLTNMLLTSGDQVVRGKLVFEKDLTAKSLNVVSGNVDGVDWQWLMSEAVRLNESGKVKGYKEFVGDVKVLQKLNIEGKLCDVDVVSLEKNAITLDGSQIIDSKAVWNDVVFAKDLLSQTVNGNRFPKDFRVLGYDDTWNFERLTLPSTKMMSLNVYGRINGLDLNEDVVTTHSRQVIFGKKTFTHARLNNVTLLANDHGIELHLTELKAAKVIVYGRHYPEISVMLEHSARTVNEDLSCHTITFKGQVVFENNVEMPSSIFDSLMPRRSDIPLELFAPSFHRVEFGRDVTVSGLVNGVNLRRFVSDTLLTTGDQKVYGQVQFGDVFTAAAVRHYETVLGMDFAWFRERSILKVTSELQLFGLGVGRLAVDRRFCGVDLKEFLMNTVRSDVSQRIVGKKTFRSSLVVDSVEAKLTVMIGSKDFGYLVTNSIYSDEDFVIGGATHFIGPVRVASVNVDFVNGVYMKGFFDDSLLLDESRKIVIVGSLEAQSVDANLLNGLNVTRYFSEVVLTTSPTLSKYVTFDKIIVKERLTFSGTINGLRMEDFIFRGQKNVIVVAPKYFSGQVYVTGSFDVARGFSRTVPSLESVDRLMVDGSVVVSRLVDGIEWNEFLQDAVIIRPGEGVTLKGILNFDRLNLDDMKELHGLFNGINLKKLNSSMLTVNSDQVIDSNVMFNDVIFRGALLAAKIEVSNELSIKGRDLQWWLHRRQQNVRLPIIFAGPVMLYGNLDVTGTIDGVRLNDALTLNDHRPISGMIFSVLVVEDLHVNGLLMGVNISEWSNRATEITGSNIRIGGSKTLDHFVPLGNVKCSLRPVVGSDASEIILPKCQAGNTPLMINSDVTIENGGNNVNYGLNDNFNFSFSPASCASVEQLYSDLNELSLQLDGYEVIKSFGGRLLCNFLSGTHLQSEFVSITLSCSMSKRYIVVIERIGSKNVSFVLPETVTGTVEACYAFYERQQLIIVMDNSRKLSSQVVMWSSASNLLVEIDSTLEDMTMFHTDHYSKVWLATTSVLSNGRFGVKRVNIWSWSSVSQTFERLQSIEQPYGNVVARFVQSTANLVISSYDGGGSSLVTALKYFEDSNEFVSKFSTIENVDSSTMAVCYHERITVILFLNHIGNLVVLEYEELSSPVSRLFRISPSSKVFCLHNTKCPMILVHNSFTLKAYCYRGEGLLEMGTIFTKDVARMTTVETNEHSYISIQTKPLGLDGDCKFGDLFVYRRLNYDYVLNACMPGCKEIDGTSNAEKVILSGMPSLGLSVQSPVPRVTSVAPKWKPVTTSFYTEGLPIAMVVGTDMTAAEDYQQIGEISTVVVDGRDVDVTISSQSIDESDRLDVVLAVSTEEYVVDKKDSVDLSTMTSIDDERKELLDVTTESYIEVVESFVKVSTIGTLEPDVESMLGLSTETVIVTDEDEIVILPTETMKKTTPKDILKVATEYVIAGGNEKILKPLLETIVETSDEGIVEMSTSYSIKDVKEAVVEVSTEAIVKMFVEDTLDVSTEYFMDDRKSEIVEVSTEVIADAALEDIDKMSTEYSSEVQRDEIFEASTEVSVVALAEDIVGVSTEYFTKDKREAFVLVSTETDLETPIEDIFEVSTEYFMKDRKDEIEPVSTEIITEATAADTMHISTEFISETLKEEDLKASTETITKTVMEDDVIMSTEYFTQDRKDILVATTEMISETAAADVLAISTEHIPEHQKEDLFAASTEFVVDRVAKDFAEVSTEYIVEDTKEYILLTSTETIVKTATEDLMVMSTEPLSDDKKEEIFVVSTEVVVDTGAEDLLEVSTEFINEEEKEEEKEGVFMASTETFVETATEDLVEFSTAYISEDIKSSVLLASTEIVAITSEEPLVEMSTEYVDEDQMEEIFATSTEFFVDTLAAHLVEVSTEFISDEQKEGIFVSSTEAIVEKATEDVVELSTEFITDDRKEEILLTLLKTIAETASEDLVEPSTEYISDDKKEEILLASTESIKETTTQDLVEVSTEFFDEGQKERMFAASTEIIVDTATEDLLELSTEYISDYKKEDILFASTETIVETTAEDFMQLSTEYISDDKKEEILLASTETIKETTTQDLVEVSTEFFGERQKERMFAASTEIIVETVTEDLVELSTEYISDDRKEEILLASTEIIAETAIEDLVEVSTEFISKDLKEKIFKTSTEIFLETATEDLLEWSTETMVEIATDDLVELSTEHISDDRKEILLASTETIVETTAEDIVQLSTEYISDDRKEILLASTETMVETATEDLLELSTEYIIDDRKEEILLPSTETMVETATEDLVELSTEYISDFRKEEIQLPSTETIAETATEGLVEVSTEYISDDRKEDILQASTETIVETTAEDLVQMSTKYISEDMREEMLLVSTETYVETATGHLVEVSTAYISEDQKEETFAASTEAFVDTIAEDLVEVSTGFIIEDEKEESREVSTEAIEESYEEDVVDLSTEYFIEEQKEDTVKVSTETIVEADVEDFVPVSTEYFVEDQKDEILDTSTEYVFETEMEGILEVSTEEQKESTKMEFVDISTESLKETVVDELIERSTPYFVEDVSEEMMMSTMSLAEDGKEKTDLSSEVPFDCKPHVKESLVSSTMKPLKPASTSPSVISPVSGGPKTKEIEYVATEAAVLAPSKGGCVQDSQRETIVETSVEDVVEMSTENLIEDRKYDIVAVSTEATTDTSLDDINGHFESSTHIIVVLQEDAVSASTESVDGYQSEMIVGMSTERIVETSAEDIEVSTEHFLGYPKDVILDVSTDTIVETSTKDILGLSTEHTSEDEKEGLLESSTVSIFGTLWDNIFAMSTEYFIGDSKDSVEVSTEHVIETVAEDVVELSTVYFIGDSKDGVEISTEHVTETVAENIVELSTVYISEDKSNAIVDVSTENIVVTSVEDLMEISSQYVDEDGKKIFLESSTEVTVETPVEDIVEVSTKYFTEGRMEVLHISTENIAESSEKDVQMSTEYVTDGRISVLEVSTENIVESAENIVESAENIVESAENIVESAEEDVVELSTEFVTEGRMDVLEVSTENIIEFAKEDVVELSTEFITEGRMDILEVSTENIIESAKEDVGVSTEYITEGRVDVLEVSTENSVESAEDDVVELSTEYVTVGRMAVLEVSTENVVESAEEDVVELSTEFVTEGRMDVLEISTENIIEFAEEDVGVSTEYITEGRVESLDVSTENVVESAEEDVVELSTEFVTEGRMDVLAISTENIIEFAEEDVGVSTEYITEGRVDALDVSTENVVESAEEDVVELSTEFVTEGRMDVLAVSTENVAETAKEDVVEVFTGYVTESRMEVLQVSTENILESVEEDGVELSTEYVPVKEDIVEVSTEHFGVDQTELFWRSTEFITEATSDGKAKMSTEYFVKVQDDILKVTTEGVTEIPEEGIVEMSTFGLEVSAETENSEFSTFNVVDDIEDAAFDFSTESLAEDKSIIDKVSTPTFIKDYSKEAVYLSTEKPFEIKPLVLDSSTSMSTRKAKESLVDITTVKPIKQSSAIPSVTKSHTRQPKISVTSEYVATEAAILAPSEGCVQSMPSETIVEIPVEDTVVMSTEDFIEDGKDKGFEVSSVMTIADTFVEEILKVSTEYVSEDQEVMSFDTSTEVIVETPVEDIVEVSTEDNAESFVEDLPKLSTENYVKDLKELPLHVSTETMGKTSVDVTDIFTEDDADDQSTESVKFSTKYFSETERDLGDENRFTKSSDTKFPASSMADVEVSATDSVEVSSENVIDDEKAEFVALSTETHSEMLTELIPEYVTNQVANVERQEVFALSTETFIGNKDDHLAASTEFVKSEDKHVLEFSTTSIIEDEMETMLELTTESPAKYELETTKASSVEFSYVITKTFPKSLSVKIPDEENVAILTDMFAKDRKGEKVTSELSYEVKKPQIIDSLVILSTSTTSKKPVHSPKHSTVAASYSKEPKRPAQTVTIDHVAATEAVVSASAENTNIEGMQHSNTSVTTLPMTSTMTSIKDLPCDDNIVSGSLTVSPVAEIPQFNVVGEDSNDCDDTNTDSAGFTVTDIAIAKDEDVETEFTSTMTTFQEDDDVTEALEEFSTIMSTTEEDGSLQYGGGVGCDI